MPRVVRPDARGVVDNHVALHDQRAARVIVVIGVHDLDVAPRPVKTPEEETRRDPDRRTPIETERNPRAHVVTGPRSPVERRMSRIPPRPVHHERVVVRDIHDLGMRRLDHDCLVPPDHVQLLGALQMAGSVGLLAQLLDGLHYVRFLGEERFAQVFGPLAILVHHRQYLRERRQGFDARVPVLVVHRPDSVIARKARMVPGPASGLGHLERIGGCHQNLRQQRIGIERYGRQQPVEILLAEREGRRRGRRVLPVCKRGGKRRGQDQGEQSDPGTPNERLHDIPFHGGAPGPWPERCPHWTARGRRMLGNWLQNASPGGPATDYYKRGVLPAGDTHAP